VCSAMPSRSVVLCVTALLPTPLTFSLVHFMLQARGVGAAYDIQGGLLRRARRRRRGRYVLFSCNTRPFLPGARAWSYFTPPPPASSWCCASRAALPGAVHVAQTGAAEGCTVAAAAAAARYGPPPAKPSRLAAAPCVCVLCCSPHHRITRALLLQSGVPGAARVVQTSHTEASTVAAVQVRAFPRNTQPLPAVLCVCGLFITVSLVPSCCAALQDRAAGRYRWSPTVAAGQVRALPCTTRPLGHMCAHAFISHIPHLLARVVLLLSQRGGRCSRRRSGPAMESLAMAPCRYEHCPGIPRPCAMRVSLPSFLPPHLLVRLLLSLQDRLLIEMSTVAAWQGTCPPQR
jgi:hypothetical protein